MSWKGLISRMSDECLITLETVFLFYTQYQAVMRKFTLTDQSLLFKKWAGPLVIEPFIYERAAGSPALLFVKY